MKKIIIIVAVVLAVFVLLVPIKDKKMGNAVVEYAPISKIYKVTVVDIGPYEGVQIEIFGEEVYSDGEVDLD